MALKSFSILRLAISVPSIYKGFSNLVIAIGLKPMTTSM